MITLKAPENAIAFHVIINGKPIDRWQIPFVTPGKIQEFPILDLPAEREVQIEISAIDGSGNTSPAVTAIGKTSGVLKVPKVPDFPFKPNDGNPNPLGSAKVWAYPEITNVDPVTGIILFEKNGQEIRLKNPVRDGASGTVRLAAERGEIASFQ